MGNLGIAPLFMYTGGEELPGGSRRTTKVQKKHS